MQSLRVVNGYQNDEPLSGVYINPSYSPFEVNKTTHGPRQERHTYPRAKGFEVGCISQIGIEHLLMIFKQQRFILGRRLA